MNKRDFLRILPGIFCIPNVNVANEDLKSLSFNPDFVEVNGNKYHFSNKSNELLLNISFAKSGEVTKLIGTLNGVSIEAVRFELSLVIPALNISNFGKGLKTTANDIWTCEISYKNK